MDEREGSELEERLRPSLARRHRAEIVPDPNFRYGWKWVKTQLESFTSDASTGRGMLGMNRFIVLLLLASAASVAFAGETDTAPQFPWSDKTKPYGIEKLEPFTTSRVKGQPDAPPPYCVEPIFTKLKFDNAVDIVNSPDNKRWFICQELGQIYSFSKDPQNDKKELFMDIRRPDQMKLSPWDRPRLWSLAFHPKFSSNGFVYVCYLDQRPRPLRGRISRYTVDLKNPLVCNKDTELILLEWVAPVDHYGGCLKFGPDGMLYCSTGDGAATSDHNNTGQDISDLTSSVIRIDVDRVENGRMYGIPPDNPFVKHPGARGEVWAYGLRNIWKMSFDRKTGELWGGDVGQDLWDMIYLVEKGGNYGWSVMEGSHPFRTDRKVGPTPIIPPVAEHDHAEARSITGGFVYRGSRLPELQGQYIYGDYETGKFFGFRYEGKKMLKPNLLADSTVHIVGFGEDDDGELVVLDYSGLLYQLTKAPAELAATDFPKQLSQTGLYSSVKDHVMAPGVIPYNVNAPLWSDHAIKDRYIALPPGKKINYSANGAWNFPDGTILVKTFAMQMKAGDPASNRRLETRLMHLESGQWRFYTYLWNEAQTDAELLGKGSVYRDLEISDPAAPGGIRKQTWHFPSRTECTLCHTAISGFALGLNTAQMNRVFNYAASPDNQIRTLEHLGLFSKPLSDFYKPSSKPDDPPPSAAKFANPYDPASGSLDDRARSYLHSNCAHCHRIYGGGNALFQLTRWTPLESTATLHAMPTHGDYGIADARIIAPGEPERSMLLFRMSKRGQGRMPHVGSAEPDEAAVKLIREWISSLPKTPNP